MNIGDIWYEMQDLMSKKSIFVKFKVKGEDNKYILAWTTTPWTLPSNVALCVNPTASYAEIKVESGETYILAEALVGKLFEEYYKRELMSRKILLQVFNRGEFSHGHLEDEPNRNLIFKDKGFYDINKFTTILKHSILISDLTNIFMTTEGIENSFKKDFKSIDELVINLTTKRYTSSRIKRLISYILTNTYSIEDFDVSKTIPRVTGFNDKGKAYLSKIKKDTKYYNNKEYDVINKYMFVNQKCKPYIHNIALYEFDMDYFTKLWYSNDEKEKERYKYLMMMDLRLDELREISGKDRMVGRYMSELERVNELRLSNNNLTEIDLSKMYTLTGQRPRVDLSNNKISAIGSINFGAKQFASLDLSFNNLQDVDVDALSLNMYNGAKPEILVQGVSDLTSLKAGDKFTVLFVGL